MLLPDLSQTPEDMGVIETLRQRMRFGRAACVVTGVEVIGVAAGLQGHELTGGMILGGIVGLVPVAKAGYDLSLNRYQTTAEMPHAFTRFLAKDSNRSTPVQLATPEA